MQFVLYQYGLSMTTGEYIEGTLTFQIKPELPKIPKVNQDGTVSRQNIATTWKVYAETVKALGQSVEDYSDMKVKLKGKTFHNLIRNFRSPEEMQHAWDYYVNALGQEMHKRMLRPKSKLTRMPTYGYRCHNCEYRRECLEMLRGDAIHHERIEVTIKGK